MNGILKQTVLPATIAIGISCEDMLLWERTKGVLKQFRHGLKARNATCEYILSAYTQGRRSQMQNYKRLVLEEMAHVKDTDWLIFSDDDDDWDLARVEGFSCMLELAGAKTFGCSFRIPVNCSADLVLEIHPNYVEYMVTTAVFRSFLRLAESTLDHVFADVYWVRLLRANVPKVIMLQNTPNPEFFHYRWREVDYATNSPNEVNQCRQTDDPAVVLSFAKRNFDLFLAYTPVAKRTLEVYEQYYALLSVEARDMELSMWHIVPADYLINMFPDIALGDPSNKEM